MLGLRLYERHLVPAEAESRRLADEFGSRIAKLRDRLPDVSNLKRDVVHGLPSPLQEPPDRCVGTRRGEELDSPGAEPQVRCLSTFVVEALPQLELRSVEPLVRVDRYVEIRDGKSNVVDTEYVHEHSILDG